MTPREKSATSFPCASFRVRARAVKTRLITAATTAALASYIKPRRPLVYNSSEARAARAMFLGRYAFTARSKNKMTRCRTIFLAFA